jgi:hypothetical protein
MLMSMAMRNPTNAMTSKTKRTKRNSTVIGIRQRRPDFALAAQRRLAECRERRGSLPRRHGARRPTGICPQKQNRGKTARARCPLTRSLILVQRPDSTGL